MARPREAGQSVGKSLGQNAFWLLLGLLCLALPARAQLVMGRTPYDKFVEAFFSGANTNAATGINTNANALLLGLRFATLPHTNPVVLPVSITVSNAYGQWKLWNADSNTVIRAGLFSGSQFTANSAGVSIKPSAQLVSPIFSGAAVTFDATNLVVASYARLMEEDNTSFIADFNWHAPTTNTLVRNQELNGTSNYLYGITAQAIDDLEGEITVAASNGVALAASSSIAITTNRSGDRMIYTPAIKTGATLVSPVILNFLDLSGTTNFFVGPTTKITHDATSLTADFNWHLMSTNTLPRWADVLQASNSLTGDLLSLESDLNDFETDLLSGALPFDELTVNDTLIASQLNVSSSAEIGNLTVTSGSSFSGNAGFHTENVQFDFNPIFAQSTVNRAAILDAQGRLSNSVVTASELTILSGTTNRAVALDFANTSANSSSDLPVTITGVTSNNCAVVLGIPWEAASGGGTFSHFESNNTVFVRFANNTGSAINPNPATFTVVVLKTQ